MFLGLMYQTFYVFFVCIGLAEFYFNLLYFKILINNWFDLLFFCLINKIVG